MSNEFRQKTNLFRLAMEGKLVENSHKNGWEDCDISWLLEQAECELQELREAMMNRNGADILHEAADVANFVMMAVDNANELIYDNVSDYDDPPPEVLYMHKNTGNVYERISDTILQTDKPLSDDAPIVIYKVIVTGKQTGTKYEHGRGVPSYTPIYGNVFDQTGYLKAMDQWEKAKYGKV